MVGDRTQVLHDKLGVLSLKSESCMVFQFWQAIYSCFTCILNSNVYLNRRWLGFVCVCVCVCVHPGLASKPITSTVNFKGMGQEDHIGHDLVVIKISGSVTGDQAPRVKPGHTNPLRLI